MADLKEIAVIGGTGAQGLPVVKGEGGYIFNLLGSLDSR